MGHLKSRYHGVVARRAQLIGGGQSLSGLVDTANTARRELGFKPHDHPVNSKDGFLTSPDKTAWLFYNLGWNLTNSYRLNLANQWLKLQCVRILNCE